jgi:hypothetical protein
LRLLALSSADAAECSEFALECEREWCLSELLPAWERQGWHLTKFFEKLWITCLPDFLELPDQGSKIIVMCALQFWPSSRGAACVHSHSAARMNHSEKKAVHKIVDDTSQWNEISEAEFNAAKKATMDAEPAPALAPAPAPALAPMNKKVHRLKDLHRGGMAGFSGTAGASTKRMHWPHSDLLGQPAYAANDLQLKPNIAA